MREHAEAFSRDEARQSEQEDGQRSLRAVVGGYDISRWPLRVPRVAGESLESWLGRLAHRYGLHPRRR